MHLTALEIQGFKSFPDRTKVAIGPGITAVVGPNGSGKSNLSDAIRWVLGETSAKQLRGGGKMENVIFGGTQQRGAMGFASVNLYIDNADHRLDVNAEEVVIGRKYYRSGESEYTVNGQNVRLRDVYELFLDTGLGRDGYSIIGQGRIAEIVGAKSNERREIFEEASGIAKYRYRKNEAERRLASAEENLVRLRDILGELEQRVGPLEQESTKAKQYLELAGRRKELEVTLWVDTVRRAKDALREQQRKIEIANADHARLTQEMDAIENDTADIRAEIEQYIIESDHLQQEIRSVTQELAGADTRIAVLKTNIEHNTKSAADLRAEIERHTAGREDIAAQRAQHEQAIAACEAEVQEQTARAAELQQTLTELQQKSAAAGERRGIVAAKLNELSQRITQLKVQAASARSTVETAGERLAAARAARETNETQRAQLEQEKKETDAFLADAKESVTRLENIKGGLSMKLESRQKALDAADAAQQALTRDIENTQQRVTLLKDLERSMDGYGGSVKTVMRAFEGRRLRGIIGPVAGVLRVKKDAEVAIETALGFALQNIVVENEGAAKAAIALLRDERAGRATFLPLDTVKPSRFDARLPEGAVLASSLVEYDARYENIVSNLLGRIVVVDDINAASAAARSLDYRCRVVTRDGQVINAGGSFTGGSVSKSAGLFSRRQELDDLAEKLTKLQARRAGTEKETDAARAACDAVKAELTATESELITAGGDQIRGEVEQNRVNSALAAAVNAAQQLTAECAQLEESIRQNTDVAAAADGETQQLAADSTQFEQELAALAGSDDEFLKTRERLADEISQLRLSALAGEKDAESHRAAIEALAARTGDADERVRLLQENIAALTRENETHAAAIADIEKSKETGHASVAEKEAKIAEYSRLRMEKEGGITQQNQRSKQLVAERESVSGEIARLTEQKQARDAEYEQTVGKLWDEYELSLSDAEALCVPFETVTELRRGVNEVRAKIKALGNVNVGAIEEYAEVSERYEFMRTQVGDVEQSKKELLELIAELSEEMRTMFTDSFAQINRNFGRIFAELFGGGTARLYLEDAADVLESGINIEVSPPGKIIRDLSALSGGEQALVAISIYFAILAVNPAPFCILDEIEAALDDVNVVRFAQYLRRITDRTQFIVITHRRGTMEEADVLYGVTMQEDGVSKLLKLDVASVDASLVS